MANSSTISLLTETSKGVEMAIFSFNQLLERIHDPAMKKIVSESNNDHLRLKAEVDNLLKANEIEIEEPGFLAKTMSWMDSSMKLAMEDSDRVIADIITKGCEMGSRTLRKYINEYAESDLTAAETAKKLIKIEENLEEKLRLYL